MHGLLLSVPNPGLDLLVVKHVAKQLEDRDPQLPVRWRFRALLVSRSFVDWVQATKQAACGY